MTETEKDSDLSDLSEYESEKESEDENEEIDPNQLADFPTIVKLGRLFFSTFFIKYYKKKTFKSGWNAARVYLCVLARQGVAFYGLSTAKAEQTE